MAALVACLPLTNFANTAQDTVHENNPNTEAEAAAVVKHSDGEHGEKTKEEKNKENLEHIMHHVKDSHDVVFFSNEETGEDYGFPLPVILIDGDAGVKVFSSSRFDYGKKVAEVDGNYYKIYEGNIYKTDAQGNLTFEGDDHEHPTNAKPLDLSITKNVLMIFITALLMLLIFGGLARTYPKNGGIARGIGRYFEPLVMYIRDEIAIPNIGEKHYKRYMSYLLTIFFFIWFLNMFGLTPLGVNVTGNIAITFALAILTYIITTFTGKKDYWQHIFWMPGVPWPMRIVLAPIELLGTLIKPFSLMIRLYANIFAGHIVLMTIISMMFVVENWLGRGLSFLLAFVLSILEILVALLQAYIFTMLSALYFGAAVEEHHHEEAH